MGKQWYCDRSRQKIKKEPDARRPPSLLLWKHRYARHLASFLVRTSTSILHDISNRGYRTRLEMCSWPNGPTTPKVYRYSYVDLDSLIQLIDHENLRILR